MGPLFLEENYFSKVCWHDSLLFFSVSVRLSLCSVCLLDPYNLRNYQMLWQKAGIGKCICLRIVSLKSGTFQPLVQWWITRIMHWNPSSNVIALHHLCPGISLLNILDCQDIRMQLSCQNTFQAWENLHFKQTAETQLDKHPWLITLLKHTHVRAMLIPVTNWDDQQTDVMFVW